MLSTLLRTMVRNSSPNGQYRLTNLIPVRKASLVAYLSQQLSPEQRGSFASFCKIIASILHHEY